MPNKILKKLIKSIEKAFHDDAVSAKTLIKVANILESIVNITILIYISILQRE